MNALQRLAIQEVLLNIMRCVRTSGGRYGKLLPGIIFRVQTDGDLIEERSPQAERRIRTSQSFHIKQSHRRDHIPGTQLPLVFVLSISISVDSIRTIKLIQNGTHPFLGEIRTSRLIKEPGDMQTRLVPLIIERAQSGKGINVRSSAKYLFLGLGKDAIQTSIEGIYPHFIHQGRNIMRRIKGILPGISLLESTPNLKWIKIVDKLAIRFLRTDKIQRRIIKSLPTFGEIGQLIIMSRIAQGFRPLSYRPRAERIFQCMRCREHKGLIRPTSLFQMRHIAILHELIHIHLACSQRTVLAIQLIFQASFVSQLRIKITDTTLISSGYDHGQEISTHSRYKPAIGYTIGQPSGIFIYLKMTTDVIGKVFRIS